MKIGIVCPYDVVRGGGVQEHVLAQAEILRERGHTVKIVTPRPRNQDTSQLSADKFIFVGNSTKVKTPIKTSLELGASLGRDTVDDMLAEENFDLLHIHEPEVPILGSQIIAKADCPIVATFHAVYPETPMARTIETFRVPYSRSIFSRLTELTAVSDAAATFVRERTGRTVHIVPNGIDLTKYQFEPQAVAKSPKKILYIGRLEKRKGVLYLLKAYRKLVAERDDIELLIAGNGELRDSLEAYVQRHNLPRVHFLGYISDAEKFQLLHEAAVFCSPALYGESFGIVLLEAMASGTVIVAGDNAGYKGVLSGTGRQSVVDPKHTDGFARRLDLMLDDVAIRTAWLHWAQSEIVQYDYQKVVNQYEKIYTLALKHAAEPTR